MTDFLDQGNGCLAVDRLGVEQVLIAERDCVLGQGDHGIEVDRKLAAALSGQHHETVKVVRVLEVRASTCDEVVP